MISVNFFQISYMLENAPIVGGKTIKQIRRPKGTFAHPGEGTVRTNVTYVPLHFHYFYVLDGVCRTVNVFLNIGCSFN